MKYLDITSCCFAESNCHVHIDAKYSTLLESRESYFSAGREIAEIGNDEREKNSAYSSLSSSCMSVSFSFAPTLALRTASCLTSKAVTAFAIRMPEDAEANLDSSKILGAADNSNRATGAYDNESGLHS